MAFIKVKIGKETVMIDREVFERLLDYSPIKEYKTYMITIETNEISFKDLKTLSLKAGVPYPIFFASKRVCEIQLSNRDRNIYEKLPYKDQIKIGARGSLRTKDIALIVQDMGRKQEFLKKRVLPKAGPNKFIGSLVKLIKEKTEIDRIASMIRKEFSIDLDFLRNLTKEKVIDYLRNCIERNDILVSFSSHNYMPQNLDRNLLVSGVCIKDTKFPFIFINTRDGDERPLIIESEGRQIFTLLTMLVCVGLNEFILSSSSAQQEKHNIKMALQIASEIIIPKDHLDGISLQDIDALKEKAHSFCVTPSMLLYQLERHKKISQESIDGFRVQLTEDLKKTATRHRRSPLPVTGYSKYNGHRFSREVIKAQMNGQISQLEVRNILFRKGKKMDAIIWQRYVNKFKLLP